VTIQVTVFLHCCMCTSHGGIFKIKAPKKATRDAYKQMIQSRVYALQREYCPDADSLGQWRKSYHDIISTKLVVSITLDPPPASGYLPTGACLHDKPQSRGGSTVNA